MNKLIIFQELAEQHLVLVTIFVSLHPLALTIIEDNCSGHSTQHLQDEVIHLRIKVSTSQNLDFHVSEFRFPDMATGCQHISYPLACFGPLLWPQSCLPVFKADALLSMVDSAGFLCCCL